MATADEKKALGFLLLLALIGGGVRWVGVQTFERDVLGKGTAPQAGGAARALSAQMAAIDSVRRSPKAPRKSTRSKRSKPDGGATGKTAQVPRAPKPPPEPPPLLDINAATAAELERLPRVGPALAQRIVTYRDKHGPFASGEALRHVRGIGPSTVRLLEPLVTFSGRHRP